MRVVHKSLGRRFRNRLFSTELGVLCTAPNRTALSVGFQVFKAVTIWISFRQTNSILTVKVDFLESVFSDK